MPSKQQLIRKAEVLEWAKIIYGAIRNYGYSTREDMAEYLNACGYLTSRGCTWTGAAVGRFMKRYDPVFSSDYSVKAYYQPGYVPKETN